ncbi:MAG: recombinase family protein [Nanoarchaeota archaeon]|nr:recombinase family protein [Nanoarchaeota archaeon]
MILFHPTKGTKKAVAYYRHSDREKQENSISIQRDHVKKYAARFNIEVIFEEFDKETGLVGPDERIGFGRLFDNWIKNHNAPHFDFVLVFDESRWGRFQNDNAAPHYEYLCNEQGKYVIYVENGISPEDQKTQLGFKLHKSIKRHMAAQFSLDLSNKVYHGCVKVSQQGFSAGGSACYGMVRVLLDVNKNPVGVLKKGEHKAISNARVTFKPADDRTSETVKEIFFLFDKGMRLGEIAKLLNERGIPSAKGGKWNGEKLLRILTNETYTGTRIYNKTWSRLRQKTRSNPRTEWVVKEEAFPGIIDRELFFRVQERLYWMMPSRWKQGVYAIRKAHRLVQDDLRKLLNEYNVSEDYVCYFLRQFPIVYAVGISPKPSIQCWCFTIPDELRRYQFIIGIGVSLNRKDPVDRIFVIPSHELGLSNISVFSENDTEFSKYKIEEDKIKEKISHLAQAVLAQ